jgi:hypothetical protein
MLLAKCVGQGDDLVVARLDALGTAIEEAGLLMLGSMDRRAGADQSGVPLQKKFSVDGYRIVVVWDVIELATDCRALMRSTARGVRGKVLGCWCHPAPCHGDVLCEAAAEWRPSV